MQSLLRVELGLTISGLKGLRDPIGHGPSPHNKAVWFPSFHPPTLQQPLFQRALQSTPPTLPFPHLPLLTLPLGQDLNQPPCPSP